MRLALAALLLAGAAHADTGAPGDYAAACFEGSGSPRRDLVACSLALQQAEDPNSRASLRLRRAQARIHLGELAPAAHDLDAALEAMPWSAEAHRLLGVVRAKSGAQGEAEAAFARALELNPHFPAALKDRGVARLFAGKPEDAAADLGAALAAAPYDAEGFTFHGFALFALGRFGEAHERFEQARALGYPYPYLALWRALALKRAGAPWREPLREAPTQWPRALMKAVLEPGAERALQAMPRARRAEAAFYLGAFHDAPELLGRAAAEAAPGSIERWMAGWLL